MSARAYKIVVMGPMGAGKTTLVRTVAGGHLVQTDVANTDTGCDKALTTVAMDYADVALPNGDRMRLVGTPGQARFSFVWPVLLSGASGVVVLIDATHDDAATQFAATLDTLRAHAPDAPTVAGLTKVDLQRAGCLDACQAVLQRTGRHLPIVPVDTRQDTQIMLLMDVLMSEIESAALVRAHG